MKVTNCLNCPFMVVDIDFCSSSVDTIISCNLISFENRDKFKDNIIKATNCKKYGNLKTLKPLEDCPIKNNKIEVEFESNY